jgi:hypothetical protein
MKQIAFFLLTFTFSGFVFAQASLPSEAEVLQRREEVMKSKDVFLESTNRIRELEAEMKALKDKGDAEELKKKEEDLKKAREEQKKSYEVLHESGAARRYGNQSPRRPISREIREYRKQLEEK